MKTLDLLLLNHPPHHIALVDQDRKITYGELNQLSDEWSARLIQYHQVQTHDSCHQNAKIMARGSCIIGYY